MRLLLCEVAKGSAMKCYCTIQLPHARPIMHCIPLVYKCRMLFVNIACYLQMSHVVYKCRVLFVNVAHYLGSLQSLDWTSGLEWWTGLVN